MRRVTAEGHMEVRESFSLRMRGELRIKLWDSAENGRINYTEESVLCRQLRRALHTFNPIFAFLKCC